MVDKLDATDVAALEARFCDEAARSPDGAVSPQTLFDFGWALTKSPEPADVRRGVRMLEELLVAAPRYRREALFYLAQAHAALGAYARAKKYNDELLRSEPRNQQALELRAHIDRQVADDGLVGLAIVGSVVAGVLVTAGALAVALIGRSKR